MTPAITSLQLDALLRYDTCAVSNAIETFDARLRNEGYTNGSIRCLAPGKEPMAGYAVTVRMKSSNPPTGKHLYADRMDWWSEFASVPAPRIVVIEDVDEQSGAGSLFGETHSTIWAALGCIGAMTNGAVRDLPAIKKNSFHVYAGSVVPSHGFAHIVDFHKPVSLAGLTIHPGDLLHGDLNGVVKIPLELAPQIPEVADRMLAHERTILELCRSKDFSLGKLLDAMQRPTG